MSGGKTSRPALIYCVDESARIRLEIDLQNVRKKRFGGLKCAHAAGSSMHITAGADDTEESMRENVKLEDSHAAINESTSSGISFSGTYTSLVDESSRIAAPIARACVRAKRCFRFLKVATPSSVKLVF